MKKATHMIKRRRTVSFDQNSPIFAVTPGVHQGWVLNSILFLLRINNLSHNISPKVRLFVDKAAAYLTI